MAKQITTTIKVRTLGDGVDATTTQAVSNPSGLSVGPVPLTLIAATDLIVTPPAGAVGVLLSGSTGVYLLKGGAADVGVSMTAATPVFIPVTAAFRLRSAGGDTVYAQWV